MRARGLSREKILAKLNQAREKDFKYESGRILSSMCTNPHPSARMAHELFLGSNLGDPGLFPGSAQLEREAVAALAQILHGERSVGFIVSGGTEANLMAMYVARSLYSISEPEVIVPESAHFSFAKICSLLKLKLIEAKLDGSFMVNPASVERYISRNTVAIVGNAGSAELGTVDPICDLSEIAMKHGVYLHVDAAFGGLVLPFLRELGYVVSDFDFRLEGVQSITVDPHKMGMSTIPAGGIMFRDSTRLECIKTETPYLTEPYQYTFVGTRSGASAAATWAVFESLGCEGFKKTVKHCMELTTFLSERLEKMGLEVLLRPQMNIIAFRSANTKVLVDKLRQRGWFVSYVPRFDCARVVLMPHSTKQHLEDFLKCLSEVRPC